MFQTLIKNIALGAARHFLTGIGGSLVAQGYISADDNNQAVGAIMLVGGIAWSAYEKYAAHKAAQNAAPAPAVAPTPDNGLTGATAPLTAVEARPLAPIQ